MKGTSTNLAELTTYLACYTQLADIGADILKRYGPFAHPATLDDQDKINGVALNIVLCVLRLAEEKCTALQLILRSQAYAFALYQCGFEAGRLASIDTDDKEK